MGLKLKKKVNNADSKDSTGLDKSQGFENTKESVQNLRQVIKFDSENKPQEVESVDDESNMNPQNNAGDNENLKSDQVRMEKEGVKSESSSEQLKKESLSSPINKESNTTEANPNQTAILQHIKEFDFQIKKNQENITTIHDKISDLTKDLDDLVSLYEIVSEQMNPFVGISKVTKKRLDMLDKLSMSFQKYEHRLEKLEMMITNDSVPTPQTSKSDERSEEDFIDDVDFEQIIQAAIGQPTIDDAIEYLVEAYIKHIM